MIRVYKISLFVCLFFGGVIIQPHSALGNAPLKFSEYIQLPYAASVQCHSTPAQQKNSILFCRFHHGIDKWNLSHLFIPFREIQPGLVIQNSLYEASHHLWSVLSVHNELPDCFDFYFSPSLRAPPAC